MSRIRSHMGVGAPSILLIIVVLSLTSFGVLTLVSARADHALGARAVETTAAYYRADAAAQKQLLVLDEALLAGTPIAQLEGVVAEEGSPDTYSFLCETGDGRAIRVRIACDASKPRCAVLEYRLIHLTGWGEEDALFLASPIH